jgi:hypothetical protein
VNSLFVSASSCSDMFCFSSGRPLVRAFEPLALVLPSVLVYCALAMAAHLSARALCIGSVGYHVRGVMCSACFCVILYAFGQERCPLQAHTT